jgi:hypothetical protein
MHFLTALIIVVGFAFVLCLGLIKMIQDLSLLSTHESPAMRKPSSECAAVDDAPAEAVELHQSRLLQSKF